MSTKIFQKRIKYPESQTSDLVMIIIMFSVPVQFSSVQDGIYVLRKAHMRSAPSLSLRLNDIVTKIAAAATTMIIMLFVFVCGYTMILSAF